MESLYLLIPLSVLAVVVAVLVFFWMNKSGQFDDDQGPAWSILLDDDRPVQSPSKAQTTAEATVVEDSSETADKATARRNDPASDRHES